MGMGDAAQTMGQFFQNQANMTKALVRVAAGTPIGLFFVAPVREPTANDQTQEGNGRNANGYGNYPGATIAGYGSGTQNGAGGVPYPNYATPGMDNSFGGSPYGRMPMNGMRGGYGGGAQYSPNAGYGQ